MNYLPLADPNTQQWVFRLWGDEHLKHFQRHVQTALKLLKNKQIFSQCGMRKINKYNFRQNFAEKKERTEKISSG